MTKTNSALTTATLLSTVMLLAAPAWATDDKKDVKPNAVGAGSSWSAQVAGGAAGVTLGEAQDAMVQKINDYFSNLKTLNGRFIQTGADKKVMKGKFKMMRPGKFRFDYGFGSRQVIISDGEYLAIQDLDLGNEDRIALDQTPFRVLLRKDVNLTRDANIIEVQETDATIFLSLRDKSPDAPGIIKLTFTKSPKVELAEWITTDAQGLDTHVQVKNLKYGEKFDAKDFVIKAPERRLGPR